MLKTQHFGSSQRYTTLLTAGCSTWVPQESRKSCSFHDLLCASDTIEPTHDLWTTIRIIVIPHPRMFIARKEWHDVFVLAELVAHYHGDPAQSSPESNPKIICEKQTWTCFGPNFYSSCTYTHLMNGTWQCPLPFSAPYNTASTFYIFWGVSGVGLSAGLGFTNEWHLYHSEADVRAIGPDPFDVPTIRQWSNSWPPVLDRLESQRLHIKGMAWLTCSLLCSCRLIKFCLYMLAYLLSTGDLPYS